MSEHQTNLPLFVLERLERLSRLPLRAQSIAALRCLAYADQEEPPSSFFVRIERMSDAELLGTFILLMAKFREVTRQELLQDPRGPKAPEP